MRFAVFLWAAILGLAACQTQPSRPQLPQVAAGVDIDDLMPVDCLLPPRVKVLGSKVYTEPRRPLKTTAADCRIRGGEYVAYDRADYRWALKVWLAAAEAGDPEAQTHVGEIYEKGLGTEPNYREAFRWYTRAAEQGDRRAMLKLGRLYEKGLGVPTDPLKALNWYRRGSGLEDEGLVYAATLRAEVEKAVAVRTRKLESELARYRGQVRRLRTELQRTQQRLEEIRRRPGGAGSEEAAFLEEMLERQKRELDRAWLREAELKQLLEEKQAQVERLEKTLRARKVELDTTARELAQTRRRLNALYAELEDARRDPVRVAELERKIAEREAALDAMEEQIAGLRAEVARLQGELDRRNTVEVPGPRVEIVEPPAVVTRGKPQIRLRSGERKPILGRVSAPAGLQRLVVNGEETQPDSDGLFRVRLRGVSVATPVRIEAMDVLGRKALLEFVVVPALSPSTPPVRENPYAGVDFGRYHALVVGIDAYRQVEPLQTAVRDARAVHAALRDRYGFQSRLLLNPSREEMIAVLAELHSKLGERDNLLIYYAGHGRLAGEQGYWLPADARDDDKHTWIPNSLITDYLKIMKARHVLVIADSCYSGSLSSMAVPRPLDVRVPDRVPPKWVRAMVERRSRNVLTSGGLEPVLDAGGGGHSVFAGVLLKALREGGPVLDGYRLYQRIVDPVREAAARFGVSQTPTYAAILGDGISGEFFFVTKEMQLAGPVSAGAVGSHAGTGSWTVGGSAAAVADRSASVGRADDSSPQVQ